MLFDREQLKRMKLYNEGKTDRQIATKLNIPVTAVIVWRKVYNLKRNEKGE